VCKHLNTCSTQHHDAHYGTNLHTRQNAFGFGVLREGIGRLSEALLELEGYNFSVCFCDSINGEKIALRFNIAIARGDERHEHGAGN
jgi:hypothetical protein